MQLATLDEMKKFQEPDPAARDQAKRTARRMAAYRRTADLHGIRPATDPTIDLFDRYGIGRWAWRFTSGYAHGSEWAITSGTRLEVDHREKGLPARLRTAANMQIAADMATLTVGLVRDALADFERYVSQA